MKANINIDSKYLMIVPETEFEEQTLTQAFPLGRSFKCFVKTGLTPADIIGLKIEFGGSPEEVIKRKEHQK
jgi:hypothetical protein